MPSRPIPIRAMTTGSGTETRTAQPLLCTDTSRQLMLASKLQGTTAEPGPAMALLVFSERNSVPAATALSSEAPVESLNRPDVGPLVRMSASITDAPLEPVKLKNAFRLPAPWARLRFAKLVLVLQPIGSQPCKEAVPTPGSNV